jgi:hypothetical protein
MPSNELSKIAAEAVSKHTYFVLAASASAIGYSFKLAETAKPTYALLLFALAIVLWVISFYLGCKSVQCSISVANSYANVENIDNVLNISENFLSEDEQTGVRKLFKDNLSLYSEIIARDGKLISKHLVFQVWFLFAGAVLFMAWRIAELIYIFGGAKP